MRRYSFKFFCIILSIGSLETVSNEDYLWRASNDDTLSDVEDNILPIRGYLNDQENYAETEQSNRSPKSCLKHSHSQETQLEQPVASSTSRRSSTQNSESNPLLNYESASYPVYSVDSSNLKRNNNAENLYPQLVNDKDRDESEQNQINTEEPSSSSYKILADDVLENTPTSYETTVAENEVKSKQEKAAPRKYEKSNLDIDKKQLISPVPISDISKESQDECTDKSEPDNLTKPPKRYYGPKTYNLPSQQKYVLDGYYNAPRNTYSIASKNKEYEDRDASTFYDKISPNKHNLYQIQNIEKYSEQSNENLLGVTGSPRSAYNSNRYTKVRDPAKGEGITYITKDTRRNVMDSERVCYACSTASNPRCWLPDRKTTVKYCRKGYNACVTKTFGSGSSLTLTRDCAKTCNDDELHGIIPKYRTCSICHSDLCNGSNSLTIYRSILALPTLVLIILLTKGGSFGF